MYTDEDIQIAYLLGKYIKRLSVMKCLNMVEEFKNSIYNNPVFSLDECVANFARDYKEEHK